MVYLDPKYPMRRILLMVVLLLGAAHIASGVWLLSHVAAIARTLESFERGGADFAQQLDMGAWRSDAHAMGVTLVVIGVAALLTGLAILARSSLALAGWLAVVSFSTAFHILWCVMDWGRGTAGTDDVALTAAIMALCVFSWVRLMRPDGPAMLVGQSGEYAQ